VVPPEVPDDTPSPGEQTPLLTKAVASAACGILSMPSCVCAGVPGIILGAIAIWLGAWVRRNYRGTTASEFANLWSWIGTITGIIGIVLGVIMVIIYMSTGTFWFFSSHSRTY
jgi:hypothetical protein